MVFIQYFVQNSFDLLSGEEKVVVKQVRNELLDAQQQRPTTAAITTLTKFACIWPKRPNQYHSPPKVHQPGVPALFCPLLPLAE